ncbi:MAG: thrombospondin type 3 repeat-containing protein [Myxococcota bacterium]
MIVLWVVASSTVFAEGFQTTGQAATLYGEMSVYVNVEENEGIAFTGVGQVDVYDPSGTYRTSFEGSWMEPADSAGTWRLDIYEDQDGYWDVSATDATGVFTYPGRVFSYIWSFGVDSRDAFRQRFYVPTPVNTGLFTGTNDTMRANKIDLEGVSGELMVLVANRTGVEGDATRSSDREVNVPAPELPIYLDYPADLDYDVPEDGVSSLTTESTGLCKNEIIPDVVGLKMSFSSNLYGQAAFVCDLNDEGDFDLSGETSVVYAEELIGPGDTVDWTWDGVIPGTGLPADPGQIKCQGQVLVGTMHALLYGASVADPGVRLFEAPEPLVTDSVTMFWDDSRVDQDVVMASGEPGLRHSGFEGVESDDYYVPAEANENAHGWGAVGRLDSRGQYAWMDTWSFVDGENTTEFIDVTIADLSDDTDEDNIPDAEERCIYGTDPFEEDTDGDGFEDGEEIADGTDPLDPFDPFEDEAPLVGEGDFQGGAFQCGTFSASSTGFGVFVVALMGALRRRRRWVVVC